MCVFVSFKRETALNGTVVKGYILSGFIEFKNFSKDICFIYLLHFNVASNILPFMSAKVSDVM